MYRGWTQTDYQNKHYNINQKWLQHVQKMDTDYQNKHYNINQIDEGTLDDGGRDGGTNFILRIKEQETRLTLQEHDDDDVELLLLLLLWTSATSRSRGIASVT